MIYTYFSARQAGRYRTDIGECASLHIRAYLPATEALALVEHASHFPRPPSVIYAHLAAFAALAVIGVVKAWWGGK